MSSSIGTMAHVRHFSHCVEDAVIGDDQTESETDSDNEDEHHPREDDTDTQMDDQKDSGTSAPECRGIECPQSVGDAINSEMVERAKNRVGDLPRRELPSPSLKSTVGGSPRRTSCDGKANKIVRFADPLPMTDTESDTLERHRIILEIDGGGGNARSNCSIGQPTQEASSHTPLKATIYQPQLLIEKKANRQGEYRSVQVRPSYLIV